MSDEIKCVECQRPRTMAADKRGWRGELGDVLDMLGVREC